jgi:hypothetical protein
VSPRRKKSLPIVPVETVLWLDADYKMGSKLDISPVINRTTGLLVHEDDTQVVLAHEVIATEDYMDEDMDFTKVPKVLIIRRVKLADVTILPEEGETS